MYKVTDKHNTFAYSIIVVFLLLFYKMYNKKFRNYILLYAGDKHLSTAKIALSKIKKQTFCFLIYWLHLNGNWVTWLVCTCKCYSVLIYYFTNKYHPFFYLSSFLFLSLTFILWLVCWVILNSIQTMTPSCLLLIHPTPGYQMTQRCGRWKPGLFQTHTVNIIIVSLQINVYYMYNVLCMCEQ